MSGPRGIASSFVELKFHRLLYRVEGSMRDGYVLQIDGP